MCALDIVYIPNCIFQAKNVRRQFVVKRAIKNPKDDAQKDLYEAELERLQRRVIYLDFGAKEEESVE